MSLDSVFLFSDHYGRHEYDGDNETCRDRRAAAALFSGSEALVVTSGPAGAVVFSPDGFVAGASVSEDVVVTAGSSAVVAPAASSAAANSHPVNSHFG